MTINCSSLTFIGESTAVDTKFDINDLWEVYNQAPDVVLLLKVATCPLIMDHIGMETDISPLPGDQHSVVIAAIRDKGELVELKDGIAALPCPPHCGGKLVSFESFLTIVPTALKHFVLKLKKMFPWD